MRNEIHGTFNIPSMAHGEFAVVVPTTRLCVTVLGGDGLAYNVTPVAVKIISRLMHFG